MNVLLHKGLWLRAGPSGKAGRGFGGGGGFCLYACPSLAHTGHVPNSPALHPVPSCPSQRADCLVMM